MLRTALILVATLFVPQAGQTTDADAITFAADVHLGYGRYEEAMTGYRKALAVNPNQVRARRGLGRTLDLTGRYVEAQAEFKAGLAAAGQFDDEPLLSDLAASYAFERRFTEAETTLRKLRDLRISRRNYPGNALELLFEIALASDRLDEAASLAEQNYKVLRLAIEPVRSTAADLERITADVQLAGQRAIVAARQGRRAEAESQLKAIETAMAPVLAMLPPGMPGADDIPSYQVPAGEVAFRLGDMPRAIRLLSPMVKNVSLRGTLILGQAYEREGNLSSAREQYRRIVDCRSHGVELALARPVAESRLAATAK